MGAAHVKPCFGIDVVDDDGLVVHGRVDGHVLLVQDLRGRIPERDLERRQRIVFRAQREGEGASLRLQVHRPGVAVTQLLSAEEDMTEKGLPVLLPGQHDPVLHQAGELFLRYRQGLGAIAERALHDLVGLAERVHLVKNGSDFFDFAGKIQVLDPLRVTREGGQGTADPAGADDGERNHEQQEDRGHEDDLVPGLDDRAGEVTHRCKGGNPQFRSRCGRIGVVSEHERIPPDIDHPRLRPAFPIFQDGQMRAAGCGDRHQHGRILQPAGRRGAVMGQDPVFAIQHHDDAIGRQGNI